MMTSTLTYSFP